MKKTLTPRLIALAVAGLAASASFAQTSSITLYGTMDINVGRYKGAAAGNNGGTGVTTTSQARWLVDSGGLSTSHWGIRGSEDLGGGLSANFDLSSFIRNDTGASGRSDAIGAPVNVAADPFFSRAAWVGLRSNSAGSLRLGNIGSLLFLNSITSNAFGDSVVFSPINLVQFIGSPLSGGTGWSNSVVYDSPNMGGFTLALARSAGEGVGGANTGLRGAYRAGPLGLGLAWTDVKKNPTTFADGTTANDTKSWQLAASYNLQVVELFAHVGGIKVATTPTVTHKLWDLSAAVPLGAGKIMAGYAQRKGNEATVASYRKVLSVGYDHNLSKRTDVYLAVRNDKTRAANVTATASGTSYGVGVRHRF